LDSVGNDLRGLSALIEEDTVLQELAKSPLMLHIMTLAYEGVVVEVLPRTEVVEEQRRQLFDDYIERMFNRRKASQQYKKAQVMRWLIWLSQRIVQESQTVFLIERMQPYWLATKFHRIIYKTIAGIFCGLLLYPACGILFANSLAGLITGLGLGLTFAYIVDLYEEIETIEIVNLSWRQAINNLVLMNFCAFVSLVFKPKNLKIDITIRANQGIWNSFNNAIRWGFIFLLISMALAGLISSVLGLFLILYEGLGNLIADVITVIAFGITGGLFFGIGTIIIIPVVSLRFGGQACIQHFTLRLILYLNNYIPWNYARFLDYATERIFLQKVGGGYIFIHRMLMEHFAQMHPER